ncbi:MAG: efflux RND transporter periplasmic adaptor subunit [Chromatiaceae bacterium]|jgi:RND family efflux transporter MFP subunit
MWNHNPILRRIPVFMLGLCCGLPAVAEEAPATFDCVITPSRSVDLGTPVPGQIHQVLVDRSDTVSAGQIVASLDSRLEEANLAIADFKAATDTELSLRRTAYTIDRRTEKRLSSLAASKVASAQDKDRAARDARLAAWRLRQAQDDLQLYALEKARAETALDRRKIRSPIDGVVVARLHEPGEYIEDQPLMRIVRLDPLHVEAILPMRLFGRIEPGMSARVIPELDNGKPHLATVDLVDPMGDAGSGTFGVRLSLPNPERAIPAGLKCRVELSGKGPRLSDSQGDQGGSPQLAASER